MVGVELSRSRSNEDAPVVVTAERDRITLYWLRNDGWRSFERAHAAMSLPPAGGFLRLLTVSWSQRVAVAAARRTICIGYKRDLGDGQRLLYVERLVFNPATDAIETVDGPMALPLDRLGFEPEAGWSLWMGCTAANRLVVVTQAVRVARPGIGRLVPAALRLRLVLLSAAAQADLRDPASWRAQIIDRGGFDLDARLAGETVFVAYRQRADALLANVDPPPSGQVANLQIAANDYAAVRVRHIDLATGARTGLPNLRGEHPTFQHLDPLYVTTERALDGIVAHGADDPFAGQIKLQGVDRALFVHRLFESTAGSAWDSGQLLRYDSRTVPRNVIRDRDHATGSADYAFRQIPGTETFARIRYSTVEPFVPLRLVRFERIDDKGIEQLDFLHHWPSYQSLNDSRFVLRVPDAHTADATGAPIGGDLDPQWAAYRIVDINHADADIVGPGSPDASENVQFFPVRFDPDVPAGDGYFGDSFIGGCLAVDPLAPESGFFAYTDLGDEAPRVIVQGNVDPDDPGPPPDEKIMDPGAVTGAGQPSQTWIEITHAVDAWLDATMVGQPVSAEFPAGGIVRLSAATVGSATEVLLDFLFNLTDTLTDPAIQNLRATTPPDGLDLQPMTTAALACALALFNDPACADPSTMSDATARSNPIWAGLASTFASLNTVSAYVKPMHITLALAKHTLDMTMGNDGMGGIRLDRVIVSRTGTFAFQYRFHGSALGQGTVEARHRLDLNADRIQLAPWLGWAVNVDSLHATVDYSRHFTPAVLVSDQRRYNPVLDTRLDDPLESAAEPPGVLASANSTADARRIALTAKPVRPGAATLENVRVPVSMPIWSQLSIAALIAALIMLGLAALAVMIAGLAALLALALGLPSAIVIFIVLTAVIYFVLPPLISAILEAGVRSTLGPTLAGGLNGSSMLTYLGEAVGEDIGKRVRAGAGIADTALDAARANRRNKRLWQTIFVTENKCRVLIDG